MLLSGSTSGDPGSGLLSLTDDSNTVASTATPAGPRYNIVSGSKGDIHKEGNPHYWLNPENGKKITPKFIYYLSYFFGVKWVKWVNLGVNLELDEEFPTESVISAP